jgi:chromosome segregation ATPase
MTTKELNIIINELSGVKKEVQSLKTAVGSLQTAVGSLQTAVGSLETAVGSLEKRATSLETGQNRHENRLDTICEYMVNELAGKTELKDFREEMREFKVGTITRLDLLTGKTEQIEQEGIAQKAWNRRMEAQIKQLVAK